MSPICAAMRRTRPGWLHEIVLLLAVLATVTSLCAITWFQNEEDRVTTLGDGSHIAEALVQAIENHLDAAFRDAGNAGLSAAMLVEQAGGIRRLGGQERLHRELKRELWDDTSTARLLLVDDNDKVVASSAEYPVPPGLALAPSAAHWQGSSVGGRSFWIDEPQRSPLDGAWVLPYWCEVLDADGRAVGKVRAELRVDGVLRHYRSLDKLNRALIAVFSADGTMLMRYPARDDLVGRRSTIAQKTLADDARRSGILVTDGSVDRVTRVVAWRRMDAHPLVAAVGMDRDDLVVGWGQRANRRTVVATLSCAVIVLLAGAVLIWLRRAAAIRVHAEAVEARYWSAMETSTAGIVVASTGGDWQHANAAMCAMLGATRSQLLAPAAPGRPGLHPLQQAIRCTLDGPQESEIRIGRQDGSELWLHVQTALLRDGTGEPSSVIVHAQDVTARKQADRALRELNDDLESRIQDRTEALSRANHDLEAFTYSAAHDLRSPLGRLGSFVDVLTREIGPVAEKPARRVAAIHRQLAVMTALIDKLLAFSRLSRAALNPVAVDVGELVLDIVQELEQDIGTRRVWFCIGVLPRVRADRVLLREALANLLGNSLKYTRGKPTAIIEIEAAEGGSGGEACIRVRDNGAGFDMAFAADLFAPFKRLHGSAEFEGSGIGLSVVHRILERSGGRIWAEGVPSQGAQFWFTLPAA